MTETHTSPRFSAELWAAFWAKPDVDRAGDVLADDIVGYWQGDPTPVRGKEPYVGKIAELVNAIPDLTLDLIDSATADGDEPGEQLVFLHYVGRGTGPDGPLAFRGIDRVRARDGVVVENVIRYDVVDPT
ncbi:MAG TPA: nuclear transport factor 2 family protein [Mycobacterium sp.]|nr:nuclear transport factor 2 family protein [Mycobacterium sp.]